MSIRGVVLVLAALCVVAPATAATNIAPLGTATQSSTFDSITGASNAIDGNRDGRYSSGSTTHTQSNFQAFWQVVLPTASLIDQIYVFNRTDCCAERINTFDLTVLNGATTVQSFLGVTFTESISAPNVSGMAFDTNALGDTVRIQLTGTNFLQLAEVEIYPLAAAIPEPSTYALMLAGLVLVAFAARQRVRRAPV